jgi:hypothetical protein
MDPDRQVIFHGNPWNLSDVTEDADYWSKVELKKENYTSKDALVDLYGGTSRPYNGKRIDEKNFKVVEGGWKHDYCDICSWTIRESDDPEVGIGFTDGEGNWICTDCFDKLIKPKVEQVASRNPDKPVS